MNVYAMHSATEQDIWSYVLALPGPRRRWRGVAEALLQKRSVIWRFPWTVSMDVPVTFVLDECSKGGLTPRSISIDDVDDRMASPVSVIAGKLGLRCSHGCSMKMVADMLAESAWDITVIRGLESIPDPERSWWFDVISDLALSIQQRMKPGEKGHRLLVVVAGPIGVDHPRLVSLLQEFWYWGWFTSGDLRLLADEMHQDAWSNRSEAMWLQAVGVELAGTDPALLWWLYDTGGIPHDGETLVRLLKRYAKEKGWDHLLLQKYVPALPQWGTTGPNVKPVDRPPPDLLPLWEAGALDWHPERGVFLHSAAVAVLEQLEELEHRVWLGQTRLLLPLIDRARMELCRFMSRLFAEWEGGRSGPREEAGGLFIHGDHDETVDAEFSEILAFLRKPTVSTHPHLIGLVKHVDGLRGARNTLAHYRALDWEAFNRVWEDLEGCRCNLPRTQSAVQHRRGKGS